MASVEHIVTFDKLVHGGQALGELADGRKVFCWNALPGEKVRLRIIGKKSGYVEAIAEEILAPSLHRIEPLEPETFLGSSPWQIMTFAAENQAKKQIVVETFRREHVLIPEFEVQTDDRLWHYRNKMEFSFYGNEQGLHLAQFRRGSHQKVIVEGSRLAKEQLTTAAQSVLGLLRVKSVRASHIKSLIVRCNERGECVGALFFKEPTAAEGIELPQALRGLVLYYSTPKSPASVITETIATLGSITLSEQIAGRTIMYNPTGFFQINIPMYMRTLEAIKAAVAGPELLVDMYSGVGSIGLSIPAKRRVLVEIDPSNVAMAGINAGDEAEVVQASTEQAVGYITKDATLIVDPPRAGLHADVVKRIIQEKPRLVVYMSCNPATQARDLALLSVHYELGNFQVYNYFPRTPHIETLAILKPKQTVVD